MTVHLSALLITFSSCQANEALIWFDVALMCRGIVAGGAKKRPPCPFCERYFVKVLRLRNSSHSESILLEFSGKLAVSQDMGLGAGFESRQSFLA